MLRHLDVTALDISAYALVTLTGGLVALGTGSFFLAMAAVTALGAIQASLLCAAKVVRAEKVHADR
jgi:hypothetical protein